MNDARMTNAEAVMLCRMAKAACPQQQFDQYTPDMWHELLGDLRFEDTRLALVEVVKSQPFVSPAEIRDRVKRIRADRLLAFGPLTPPSELADNLAAEHRWMVETKQAIADGHLLPGETPERPAELLARVMPDWERVLPAPPKVSRVEVSAEKRKAKDPDHARRMAEARAELAAVPIAHPDATEPSEPEETA